MNTLLYYTGEADEISNNRLCMMVIKWPPFKPKRTNHTCNYPKKCTCTCTSVMISSALAILSYGSLCRATIHFLVSLRILEFLYHLHVGHTLSSGTPHTFIPTISSRKTTVEGQQSSLPLYSIQLLDTCKTELCGLFYVRGHFSRQISHQVEKKRI